MVRKRHTKPTTERILEKTLQFIDEQDGFQKLHLRKIARLAECAPTTIYRHFHNRENLTWAALACILHRWEQYTRERVPLDVEPEMSFTRFVASQIDFAWEHSGWYQFLWLKPLSGMPPVVVMEHVQNLYASFLGLLITWSGNRLDQPDAQQVGDILYGYLHGKICHLIHGRTVLPDKETIQAAILAKMSTLFTLLVNSYSQEP
jgi:AcrR family transcriptional regulator